MINSNVFTLLLNNEIVSGKNGGFFLEQNRQIVAKMNVIL